MTSAGQGRVVRGGMRLYGDNDLRSIDRLWFNPTYTSNQLGFRCAMSAAP